ncbi:DUF4954 family protein [Treponema sp. Marseille-Q4523]|uniref:DUF4954 family protein n=1 Tax=Treponema sp. Marseille-Q4523 TaxID=2810610 RepID=UPI001961F850|nr:DUF4954 family protein [Treponema sp. Marseille-Q4523]MBM7023514.1 DUF4954 family protein [Treponema sp. Marseille-Q4523]
MVQVTYTDKRSFSVPSELTAGKRGLTKEEIEALEKNHNTSDDPLWQNFYVDAECFDASLIRDSSFSGFIVLGKLKRAMLKYHDLELEEGIYNSKLINAATGDDNAIRNVAYFENYRLGKNVMLFNIQEMSCTPHSKFGEGILKKDEPEENRIWIGVANENGGREVLPFKSMIPADAYLWSRYREDGALMKRFVALTEKGTASEEATYGIIKNNAVIKNTTLLKDAEIGECAYIKGAFKLKNITVLSSEAEPSQIGEGVEMVNGIMGYGSRVFYQAVAVRFVIGKNCQLKYGARLLNSVLGDNSTVSCCEILNNLLFPFHEQHHNSSFLIASTIMGQSNIASGATIGSNHNSRSPDGELVASRGFWPSLSSDFKHNSRFASFVLVAKGSYQYELDIPYPFSLVALGENGDRSVRIFPAWWFMYDMFALVRNRYKFKKRDKRVVPLQHIETDPFAPDTMQEIMRALDRIVRLTAKERMHSSERTDVKEEAEDDGVNEGGDHSSADGHGADGDVARGVIEAARIEEAKAFFEKNPDADFTLSDAQCQKRYGATIFRPAYAYHQYRKIIKYFAAKTIIEYCDENDIASVSPAVLAEIARHPLYTEWLNAGGQIIPLEKIDELREKVKGGEISSWEKVHAFYDACAASYLTDKTRYALYLLECVYGIPFERCTDAQYRNLVESVAAVSNDMYALSVSSREKDYTDYYRKMTYRSREEMDAVLGTIDRDDFLTMLKDDTERFNKKLLRVFTV